MVGIIIVVVGTIDGVDTWLLELHCLLLYT